jgi:hypothetical protein
VHGLTRSHHHRQRLDAREVERRLACRVDDGQRLERGGEPGEALSGVDADRRAQQLDQRAEGLRQTRGGVHQGLLLARHRHELVGQRGVPAARGARQQQRRDHALLQAGEPALEGLEVRTPADQLGRHPRPTLRCSARDQALDLGRGELAQPRRGPTDALVEPQRVRAPAGELPARLLHHLRRQGKARRGGEPAHRRGDPQPPALEGHQLARRQHRPGGAPRGPASAPDEAERHALFVRRGHEAAAPRHRFLHAGQARLAGRARGQRAEHLHPREDALARLLGPRRGNTGLLCREIRLHAGSRARRDG